MLDSSDFAWGAMDDLFFPELKAIPSKKNAQIHGDVIESIALRAFSH
jgi:hypothetical protein